ncbi:MAG TPA: hypothetical protein VJA21_12665 [Verrucomicrobiae bacterium]
MKKTVTRAADPIELDKARKHTRQVKPLELSLEQIEGRALAKTEVLVEILAREEVSYVRHWGLNE